MIKNTVTKKESANLVQELSEELIAWNRILCEMIAWIQQYTIPKPNVIIAPTICTGREFTTWNKDIYYCCCCCFYFLVVLQVVWSTRDRVWTFLHSPIFPCDFEDCSFWSNGCHLTLYWKAGSGESAKTPGEGLIRLYNMDAKHGEEAPTPSVSLALSPGCAYH